MIKSSFSLIFKSQAQLKLIGSLVINNFLPVTASPSIPSAFPIVSLPSATLTTFTPTLASSSTSSPPPSSPSSSSPSSSSSPPETCSSPDSVNMNNNMPEDTKLHYYETHPDIVWADCEMSGLDINKDHLLEIAIIITDSDLEEITTLGPLVIKTDPHVLANMDDWCTRNHTKTGLYKACLESQLTIEQADQQLYDLLASRNMRLAVLAGNSIAFDKLFLSKFCPKFSSLLHYRTIDVSSFKEVIKRWYPDEVNLKKRHIHRALDDIRDCITELRYYRNKFFKPMNENSRKNISSPDWCRVFEPKVNDS